MKRFQHRRQLHVLALILLAGMGLAFRLVHLHVIRHEELTIKAAQSTQRQFLREPIRGEIRDIKGNLLAISRRTLKICADPTLLSNTNVQDRRPEVCRVLSPLLQVDPAELYHQLEVRPAYPLRTNDQGQIVLCQYVVLKRNLDPDLWPALTNAMQHLDFGFSIQELPRRQRRHFYNLRRFAIFSEDDQLREYPHRTLASQILGYAGLDLDPTRRVETILGKEGIELTLDHLLRGFPGWIITERDVRGREVVVHRKVDVAPQPGHNVVLTIDLGLQNILESELRQAMTAYAPTSVCGIIVRPWTGEILAMATLPSFDPNQPGASPPGHRRNRAVTEIAEPGSTFKPFAIAAAIESRLAYLNERIFCENGSWWFAGKTLRDHESYGILTVERIIAKSSNIGVAKIGIRLGPFLLHQFICRFGFGDRTGIELPGEVRGIVHPADKWSRLSLSRIPIGQGIAVSPLQLVMAMSAIGTDGQLMKPRLLDRVEDAQGDVIMKTSPEIVRQVVSPETAHLVVQALKAVVSPEGTGAKAQLSYYKIAGKTGTAEKAGRGGYQEGKYFASFVGFFPADRPELCILVALDEPRKKDYYGGQTAGPVFHNIAERAAHYLSLAPDLEPPPEIAAAARPAPTSSRH